MKHLPQTPGKPYSVLFVAEQILQAKEGSEEFEVKQPLTEADLEELFRKLSLLFAEYGLAADAYGEKEAMIKRLSNPRV